MADSDDDLQFESFDNYFSGLPIATTPIGSAPMLVFQNNTTKQTPASSVSGKTALASNLDFYISLTGSDSNPGTILLPWATLQHAANVIASTLDFAGFTVTVHIETGTFVGVGLPSAIGGGTWQWLGAGSSLTTVTNGPNDGIFNFGECFGANLSMATFLGFDAVKFLDSKNHFNISIQGAINMTVGNISTFTVDMILDSTGTNGSTIGGINGQTYAQIIVASGAISVPQRGLPSSGSIIQLGFFSSFSDGGAAWTLTGAANTYTGGSAAAGAMSNYINFTSSYTGSANGPRFGSFNNSQMSSSSTAGSLGLNFFPGSQPGVCDQTSSYDEFDLAQARSGPPTISNGINNLADSTAFSLFKDTRESSAGRGNVLYVNDAGTIFPVTTMITTFARLPASPLIGMRAAITDGLAGNCGDGSCTTWGTAVTGGGGTLGLMLWYNGSGWTLVGK